MKDGFNGKCNPTESTNLVVEQFSTETCNLTKKKELGGKKEGFLFEIGSRMDRILKREEETLGKVLDIKEKLALEDMSPENEHSVSICMEETSRD